MPPSHLSAANIYLSCMICQETLSEIYPENGKGEGHCSDGHPTESAKIPKLWLTECAHITCRRHLERKGKQRAFLSTLSTRILPLKHYALEVFLSVKLKNLRRRPVRCVLWKRVIARLESYSSLLALRRAITTPKFQQRISKPYQCSSIRPTKDTRHCRYTADVPVIS